MDAGPSGVLDLEYALNRLTALDPQQARIVELRFSGGLTVEETGEALGSSEARMDLGTVVAAPGTEQEERRMTGKTLGRPGKFPRSRLLIETFRT